MCGQHCLNNLLQGQYFTESELAEIAHELDMRERELMFSAGTETAEAIAFAAEESGNVDDSGNFSVEVCGAHMLNAAAAMDGTPK